MLAKIAAALVRIIRNQYEYARKMFDFRPQEELERKLGRPLKQRELVESIVNQVNGSPKVKRK